LRGIEASRRTYNIIDRSWIPFNESNLSDSTQITQFLILGQSLKIGLGPNFFAIGGKNPLWTISMSNGKFYIQKVWEKEKGNIIDS
jgi:hypothetical protein